MGPERCADRAGRRLRVVLRVLAASLVLVAAVLGWRTEDLPLRVTVVLAASVVLGRVVQRCVVRARPGYGELMSVASAIRVDLDHVRIAAVHRHPLRSMVTVTWGGARTSLLDADARLLTTALHNGLTTAYTMTLDVSDDAAELLARESGLGEVSVYAVVDLAAHPSGNLREHGVTVEQYDLAFPAWSVSMPRHRIRQPWDT